MTAKHWNYKHGLRKTRAFGVWWQMIQRCRNPKHHAYERYGGRGIVVCERWKEFLAFLEDIRHPPEGLTLERSDNNGNYEPSNCRWATRTEQQRNRRNNRLTFELAKSAWIEMHENGASPKRLAGLSGIPQQTLRSIYDGRSWKDACAEAERECREVRELKAAGKAPLLSWLRINLHVQVIEPLTGGPTNGVLSAMQQCMASALLRPHPVRQH